MPNQDEIRIGEGINLQEGYLGFQKTVESKFEKIDYFLFSVVLILIFMVATLVIDSFHINSATYKEYSQKTEALDILLRQTSQNERDISNLKNCLKAGGWDKCFEQQNKLYIK